MQRYRRRCELSAEQLARRTQDLGYPLSRNSITALETGRKEFISVQDLVVIAVALNVTPILLLFPVDESLDEVELLPELPIGRLASIDWFAGDNMTADRPGGLPDAESDGIWTRNLFVLSMLRGHEESVRAWLRAVAMANNSQDDEAMQNLSAEQRGRAESRIRSIRQHLKMDRLPMPPLPPGLILDGPFNDKHQDPMLYSGKRRSGGIDQ